MSKPQALLKIKEECELKDWQIEIISDCFDSFLNYYQVLIEKTNESN
jgi:hypothetical protein